MAALILRVGPRHGRGGEYRRIGADSVHIGRAFDNDLIVADPFVGAAQFRLSRAGERSVLEVLDRTNPVHLNGRLGEQATIELASGDRVEFGHSSLTVLREDTPVLPTRRLPSSWWGRLGSWRPVAAALALAGVAAASLWADFLASVDEPKWDELAAGALKLAGLLLCWSALWSIVGRSIRQQANFAGHLALACAVVLAAFGLTPLGEYAMYAFDAAGATDALDWGGAAALLFALCYGEFRLATSLRRPALAATLAVALPLLVLGGLEWAARAQFDPQPPALTLLRPPFAKLRSGRSPDDYDEVLGALFDSLPRD